MMSSDLRRLLPGDDERRSRRDALVSELRTRPEARAGVTRRRFVLASLAVTAVVAIAGVGSSAIPGTGGRTIDVVSEARAALAPQGGILHVKVRYEHGPHVSTATLYDGSRTIGRETGAFERWTATNPLRDRRIRFFQPPGGGPLATVVTDYADGVWRDHKSWRDDVWVSRATRQERLDFEARLGRAEIRALHISLDPVAAIRTLLSDGRLHGEGRVKRHGRDVLRLVGTSKSYVDAGGTFTPKLVYEYFIDPETYVPVEIVSTQILAARPDAPEPEARRERRIIQRWIFQTFERLPLTRDTASLLRMDATNLAVKHVGWSSYRR